MAKSEEARRSIEGVRGAIVKVVFPVSTDVVVLVGGMVWWTTAEWISSTRMMSTGTGASESGVPLS
jgi:hypothetical protein